MLADPSGAIDFTQDPSLPMDTVTVTANRTTDWGSIVMWIILGTLFYQMGKDAKYWS